MEGLKRFCVTVGTPVFALVVCFIVFRFDEVKDGFIVFYTTFSWQMVASVAIAGAVAGYLVRQWSLKRRQERRRRAAERAAEEEE